MVLGTDKVSESGSRVSRVSFLITGLFVKLMRFLMRSSDFFVNCTVVW